MLSSKKKKSKSPKGGSSRCRDLLLQNNATSGLLATVVTVRENEFIKYSRKTDPNKRQQVERKPLGVATF